MIKLSSKLILFLFVIIACRNHREKIKSDLTVDDSKTKISLVQLKNPSKELQNKSLQSFDWNSVQSLKTNFMNNLSQNKYPQDSLIVTFLDDYKKIVLHLNEILFNQSNYDSLNTLAYADSSKVYKCARDFENKVEKSGLKIAFSEGTIYIGENTKLIKSDIFNVIDPISKEFLNLYCINIDSICCDDAAIIISKKALAARILKWGNLLEKTTHLTYSKIASTEFSGNLNLLYEGQDNTPSFDWTTGKFDPELIQCMNEVIKFNPTSLAAKEFRTFLDLLHDEGYTRTEKVNQFLDSKFK